MEYNSYLPEYGDDDVLMFQETMFKVVKFRKAVEYAFNNYKYLPQNLQSSLASNNINITTQNCFGDGINCEVLKINSKGWKKGKVRIRVSLEFCPDEPDIEEIPTSNVPEINQTESPLDDIRQMMNQGN